MNRFASIFLAGLIASASALAISPKADASYLAELDSYSYHQNDDGNYELQSRHYRRDDDRRDRDFRNIRDDKRRYDRNRNRRYDRDRNRRYDRDRDFRNIRNDRRRYDRDRYLPSIRDNQRRYERDRYWNRY
ncbi:MAG: hypothetical protein RMY29_029925 [Nostoc sp. CreGUA01]|nr:hypothetical protein [Nostoc sp. CreGUA01]